MTRAVLFACGFAFTTAAFAATAVTTTESPAAPAAAPARAAAPAKAGKKAAVAAPAPKLQAMTAEQIVKRNVAARGGPSAWRAVDTLTLSGKVDAGGNPNVELPFVMKMKRGHKSRLELTFRDQTALQVYDGTQGWKVRPFLNRDEVEPYTPAEAKAATGFEELDGPLIDAAKKGTRVKLLGTERVEAKSAYKLQLTAKNGAQRTIWIDGSSFLELKLEGEPKKIDGRMRSASVYFRDYKTEDGLTTPRVLETVYEGTKVSRKMRITSVVANAPMQDGLFRRPQVAAAGPATR